MCLLSIINHQQNLSTCHPKANMDPTITKNNSSHGDCPHKPVLTRNHVMDKQWSLCKRIAVLEGTWQEQADTAFIDETLSDATKQSVASISKAYASLAGLASPKTQLSTQSAYLSMLNTAKDSIQSNRSVPLETLGELKRDKSQTLFNMYAAACAARNKPITENPKTLNNSLVFACAVEHVSKLSRAVRIAAGHRESQTHSN